MGRSRSATSGLEEREISREVGARLGEELLAAVGVLTLLVSVVTLSVVILTLRSSRRSEEMGEDRLELLRDQQERLELLREERRMLMEELEQERQGRLEAQQKAERLELEAEHERDLLPALREPDPTGQPEVRRPLWRRLFGR